jgi:hypothetical protein
MARFAVHRVVLGLSIAAACGSRSSPPAEEVPATPAPAATTSPAPAAAAPASAAATSPAPSTELAAVLGVWRGTSLCTVRPSPCHDETVVYYVSGTDLDHIVIRATKIVDGKELEMGELPCQLAPAEHRLACRIDQRGVFTFAIDGDRIHGTLDLSDGTRFRVIEVSRAH